MNVHYLEIVASAKELCITDWRELDDESVRRARLYVDSREAATRESGDVIAAGAVVAEIGEVIVGTRPGRRSDEEVTLFKSVGVAVEDVVAAAMVYRYFASSPTHSNQSRSICDP